MFEIRSLTQVSTWGVGVKSLLGGQPSRPSADRRGAGLHILRQQTTRPAAHASTARAQWNV